MKNTNREGVTPRHTSLVIQQGTNSNIIWNCYHVLLPWRCGKQGSKTKNSAPGPGSRIKDAYSLSKEKRSLLTISWRKMLMVYWTLATFAQKLFWRVILVQSNCRNQTWIVYRHCWCYLICWWYYLYAYVHVLMCTYTFHVDFLSLATSTFKTMYNRIPKEIPGGFAMWKVYWKLYSAHSISKSIRSTRDWCRRQLMVCTMVFCKVTENIDWQEALLWWVKLWIVAWVDEIELSFIKIPI